MMPSRVIFAIFFGLAGLTPAVLRAQQSLEDVQRLCRERRYEEAYTAARQAAAASPRDPRAYFWLGASAHYSGKLDRAKEAYLRAVDLKPDYAEALNNLGDLAEREMDWQQAIEYYEAAIQANPRLPAPHAGLGDVYRQNGAWAKAASYYEAVLRLNPGDPEAQHYLAACRQAVREEESEGRVRAGTMSALSAPPPADISTRSLTASEPDAQPPEGRRLALHVGFDRNRFSVGSLSAKARAQLEEVASLLGSNDWKGRQLTIEGHTCSCGSSQANQELGMKRAEAIRQYLVERRAVSPASVRVVSFGDAKPIEPSPERNLTVEACARDAAHSANRRVVIQEGWKDGSPRARSPLVNVSFWQRPARNTAFRPLTAGSVLRTGEQMKIVMQPSEPVYAYVLHRDPSDKWQVLFPNPKLTGEGSPANPLQPGRSYALPGERSGFVLGADTGTEETFVYASLEADPELSELVGKLLQDEAGVTVIAPPAPPPPVAPRSLEVRPHASAPVDRPAGVKNEAAVAPQTQAPPVRQEGSSRMKVRGGDIVGVAPDDANIVRLPSRPAARIRFQHR